jgi:hypothetical protein
VKQLALNWQDRIDFVLLDDLSMQSIKFSDEIIEKIKEMEAGTKQQQFNADFLIMTETLDGLFKDLLDSFAGSDLEALQAVAKCRNGRKSAFVSLESVEFSKLKAKNSGPMP